MFSIVFSWKFMENIGLANVFHEFCGFLDLVLISGFLWKNTNSWKTLARPMFSMNSLNFTDSWLVPGDSLENHEFMENIGQANVYHCFFMEIHGNIGQANVFHEFWGFLDLVLIPGNSLEIHEFMENIGLANVFHEFFIFLDFGLVPGDSYNQ